MVPALRRTVLVVALLNLAYFGVEFAVALHIGSVSLFSDSVDFLEDASVNILIFLALNWAPRSRARLGMALAGILLVPALAVLWSLWTKFAAPMPPEPVQLSLTGLGAMIMDARQLSRTEIVIAGMAVIGLAGFLSDLAVQALGKSLLAWSPLHG